MSSLPFPASFSSPKVKANGSLHLGDAWQALLDANKTFSANSEPLITTSLDAGSALQLGGGDLSFSATGDLSLGSRLRLFWPAPDRPADSMLDITTVVPDFDQQRGDGTGPLGLMLVLQGTATFNGAPPVLKTGALSAALDLKTGGNLNYARLIIGRQSDTVRSLLDQLVSGLRLPQDLSAQLQPGEVISLGYGGYLKFTTDVTWGYQLNATRALSLGNLDASIAYGVKLGPSLAVAAEAAGSFQFIATADLLRPGWVRLRVHKTNDRSAGVTFDFGAEATYKVAGAAIDRSFYETVAVLLGIDPQAIAKAAQKVTDLSNLDGLHAACGDLVRKEIDTLVQKWLPDGLAATSFADFVARLGRAAAVYTELDKTVHAFLADNPGQNSSALLAQLRAIADPAKLAQIIGVSNAPEWAQLLKWFGPDAASWTVPVAQSALARLMDSVLAATDAGVHDLMAVLDPGPKVQSLLSALASIQTPQQLQAVVDQQVQALATQLLKQPFAALSSDANVTAAFAALNSVTQKLQALQGKWADLISQATQGKFTADFAAAYKRSSSQDSLLEASFNLANPAALALFQTALAGDFTALMGADPQLVQLQQGTLQQKLTRESTLSVAIFGNNASSSFRLEQNSTLAFKSDSSGQIVIDTSETAAIRETDLSWFGDRETKLSRLALVASGPLQGAPNLKLLGANASLGVTYDVSISDNKTSPDELRDYLGFAQQLGLIPDAESVTDKLSGLLGGGDNLGALEAKYSVAITPDAIRTVFATLEPAEITYQGRIARRQYYGRYYLSRRGGVKILGKAYNYVTDAQGNVIGTTLTNTNVPDVGFFQDTLDLLFKTENDGLAALCAFDDAVDALREGRATAGDFDHAAAALLASRAATDVFLPGSYSALFAILDRLVAYATAGHDGYRRSKLELTLTPPTPAAQKVHLVFAA